MGSGIFDEEALLSSSNFCALSFQLHFSCGVGSILGGESLLIFY